MRRLFAKIAPIAALVLLAACATDVQKLHEMNPQATDFPSALASEYQAYADSEKEQGRNKAAEYYAGKGLEALDDHDVKPDTLEKTLTASDWEQLSRARSQLLDLLHVDVKKEVPQQAARAQLLFDCWHNEVKESINPAQRLCEKEFYSTLAQVRDHADLVLFDNEAREPIVFEPHTIKLNDENKAKIGVVVAKLKTLVSYDVQLEVYIGVSDAERRAATARLNAVRRELVNAGVSAKKVHVRKRGGAKAVILSDDNVVTDTKQVIIILKTRSPSEG